MATPISLSLASLTAYAPAQRVYTRHAWRDEWTLVPYLHCFSAQKSCLPDIGRAGFTWRFGQGIQPGASQWQDWPRITFCESSETVDVAQARLGRFVKVEADLIDTGSTVTVKWFGYLLDSDEQREGALNRAPADDPEDDPVRIASGIQTLTAYELSWLLSELSIDTAVVATSDDLVRMNFPLGFNMYKGGPRDVGAFAVKNRSTEKLSGPTSQSYVFSESLKDDEADPWTAFDIVEYLLEWHSPLGRNDDPDARRLNSVPFALDVSGIGDDILRWEFPRLHTENRTLWDCLTQLIDRRRSQGCYFDVDETATPNVVKLYVFPYNPEPLTVTNPANGDTITIPANDNPRTLDVDDVPFAATQIRRSADSKYDEVLIRGARRRSVFSVSYEDSTLVGDWESADQTAYNTGASGAGDYPTRVSLKKIRNETVRSQDNLWRVYRCFSMPDSWQFTAGDGEGGEGLTAVMPTSGVDGAPTSTNEPLWRPGLRLLRHLPLYKNFDYTTNVAEPTDETGGAQPEYLPCFSVFKMYDDGSGDTRYCYGHDIADTLRTASVRIATLPPMFNCSIRPQDHALGIVCEVGGGPQHMIAASEFAPLSNAGDEDGQIDWKDLMIATVAMEGDCYCEALWPEQLDNQDVTLLKRRLVLDAGDGYRLDYLTPHTVLGLDDGVLVRNEDGGWIRDDRAALLSMARMAYEWYSRERVALDLSVRALTDAFQRGHLITEFGGAETAEPLNSVITSVLWHFGSDPGDQPHTVVHTNYAELDPGSFVRRRNA